MHLLSLHYVRTLMCVNPTVCLQP